MEQLQLLFNLIKKLDKYEKNNFISLSSTTRNYQTKSYFLLYELLESNEELDVNAIKEFYKKNNRENSLLNDINYLEDQLLHSLQIVGKQTNSKLHVHSRIVIIQNLLLKEQYKIALKEIKKAQLLCVTDEFLTLSLILKELYKYCAFYLYELNSDDILLSHKALADNSYELYMSNIIYYTFAKFKNHKKKYETTKEAKYLDSMTNSYNEYNKIIKSIKRELTVNEIFLTNNIKYEYLFTIKKYNQSIIYLNATIATIEKDIVNDIQAFWLYLNLIWFAFEASCLANKKNISKEYIKRAITFSKSKLVQSDTNHLFEINKFILKMKIQNMLYFEEYSLLNDYSNMLFEILEKKSNQREFSINSLLQSKIQLSICYIKNRDIKKSYDIIQHVATDDKLTQNHD